MLEQKISKQYWTTIITKNTIFFVIMFSIVLNVNNKPKMESSKIPILDDSVVTVKLVPGLIPDLILVHYRK